LYIGYTKDALIIHDPYGNLEKGTNSNYGTDKTVLMLNIHITNGQLAKNG